MASTDLQWLLVKKTSKFYQKRNGVRMSNDPFNQSGTHTKRNSGSIQPKAFTLRLKGNQVVVAVKDGSNLNKPASFFKKTVLAADAKPSEVSRTVAAVRPDQADLAFKKAKKLSKLAKRIVKVKAASKARTAAKKDAFKRKSVRPSKKN
jgi:large subunit ribosomal protein L28e